MSAERSRPIERLASALQDCLDEAARKGAREAAREVKDELAPRLDKQDATLRLMWKQMNGSGKLPIDDWRGSRHRIGSSAHSAPP